MSELNKALCSFYKDVSVIHKEAKAQYGRFADLATVLSAVTPALAKNGLSAPQTFEPIGEESKTLLVTTLRHTSGEFIESKLPMVVGSGRNVLHDFGGSVTYLRRYALLAILGLAADVDTDGNLDQPEPAQQPKPKAATKPAAEPAPVAIPDEDQPLAADQKKELLETILATPEDYRKALVKAFATHFGTGNRKVSTCIQAKKHWDWVQDYFAKNEVKA